MSTTLITRRTCYSLLLLFLIHTSCTVAAPLGGQAPPSTGGSNLSTGALAGIVVITIVVGWAVIIAAAVCVYHKKRKSDQQKTEANAPVPKPADPPPAEPPAKPLKATSSNSMLFKNKEQEDEGFEKSKIKANQLAVPPTSPNVPSEGQEKPLEGNEGEVAVAVSAPETPVAKPEEVKIWKREDDLPGASPSAGTGQEGGQVDPSQIPGTSAQ